MSKLFGSLMSKLIGLLVVLLFVVSFKESILTDTNVSNAFGGLMKALPFSNLIVENICRIMKFNYKLPTTTFTSVGTDNGLYTTIGCESVVNDFFENAIFVRN